MEINYELTAPTLFLLSSTPIPNLTHTNFLCQIRKILKVVTTKSSCYLSLTNLYTILLSV